jgi:hypothetical protein
MDANWNVLDEPTGHRFYLLADDRPNRLTREDYLKCFDNLKNLPIEKVVWVTDVLTELADAYKESTHFDDLLKHYGVSIKLVTLAWSMKNFKKFFFMDDDILFLRPIDTIYAKHDYAFKGDSLMTLCKVTDGIVDKLYSKICDTGAYKLNRAMLINSGTMIFKPDADDTWKKFVDFTIPLFSSAELVDCYKTKAAAAKAKGYVPGNAWLLEQYTVGMFYDTLGKEWHKFSGLEVRLLQLKALLTDEPKKLKTIPNIAHVVTRSNKELMMSKFMESVNLSL